MGETRQLESEFYLLKYKLCGSQCHGQLRATEHLFDDEGHSTDPVNSKARMMSLCDEGAAGGLSAVLGLQLVAASWRPSSQHLSQLFQLSRNQD